MFGYGHLQTSFIYFPQNYFNGMPVEQSWRIWVNGSQKVRRIYAIIYIYRNIYRKLSMRSIITNFAATGMLRKN